MKVYSETQFLHTYLQTRESAGFLGSLAISQNTCCLCCCTLAGTGIFGVDP